MSVAVSTNAVIAAAKAGNEDLISYFYVVNGVSMSCSNKDGITPLMAAIEEGHEDLAVALIVWGADPHAVDKHGKTVMDRAAERDARDGGYKFTMLINIMGAGTD
jgi:uncharacterized protein